MTQPKITIQTTVHADIAHAWACYTQPEHIIHWNFASDDWCCPSAENDLRVGGRYCARMKAKDGSFGFDFEVIYDAVVEHQHLAYSMADGRQVSVAFDDQGDSVHVTVVFDPESENPLEMQRGGWQAILDNYKKRAEATAH